MPDFKGSENIVLQPATAGLVVAFYFPAWTSATARDGAIPYSTTISSAVVTAEDVDDGTDVSSDVMTASSVASNYYVNVTMRYPPTAKQGKYKLKFALTLSSGAVLEFDFDRIYAYDG